MLETRRILASTCDSASGDSSLIAKRRYQFVLIDEAAQATEPQILGTLTSLRRNGSFVQIGDHLQLPATIKSEKNISMHHDMSMFERLIEAASLPVATLDVQHRMVESVVKFPNERYYG
eukprot:9785758-Karenia_brevis.AAC.1